MPRSARVQIAGTLLEARGDRTLFWPDEATLFAADLHLGKGAAFRAGGLPVPAGTTEATLAVLEQAVRETQAAKVVILGDLWHARAGRTEEHRADLARWRADHPSLELQLVIGNHDRGAGWELPALDPGTILGPFALHHFPEEDPRGYTLCGHLHPAYRLEGLGRQVLRLPCFWFGRRVGVLPALGELTGLADVRPRAGDQVAVVAEGNATMVPIRDRSERFRR